MSITTRDLEIKKIKSILNEVMAKYVAFKKDLNSYIRSGDEIPPAINLACFSDLEIYSEVLFKIIGISDSELMEMDDLLSVFPTDGGVELDDIDFLVVDLFGTMIATDSLMIKNIFSILSLGIFDLNRRLKSVRYYDLVMTHKRVNIEIIHELLVKRITG